jgi:replicative superfamily II helicase
VTHLEIDLDMAELRSESGSAGILKETLLMGVAYHNSGLSTAERAIIERLVLVVMIVALRYVQGHTAVVCFP